MKTPSFLQDVPFASETIAALSRFRKPTRKGVANWLRRNALVAVLALFASTVIYIGLQEKITQKTYTVKVSVRPVEDGATHPWWPSAKSEKDGGTVAPVRVFAAKPSSVEVTLSGSVSELQLLDESKLEFLIPGGAIKADPSGRNYAILRNHYLKGTSGLNVFKVRPERVQVDSDSRADRTFQIATPRMEVLRPFKGHAEIQVRPNRATVSGWASQLENLANSGAMLELKPVRVDGSLPSFTQEVEVFAPMGDGDHPMTVSPSRVSVTVEIVPDTMERVFSNVTVNVAIPAGSSFPAGYRLSRKSVSISLVGQEKSLSVLSVNDVSAYVDIPTYTNRPGKTLLPVRIWVQPNVWVTSSKASPESLSLIPPSPPPMATNPPPAGVRSVLPASAGASAPLVSTNPPSSDAPARDGEKRPDARP